MQDSETASEWKSGGPTLVGAALANATGTALFLTTTGLFVKPISETLGWSRGEVAFATTLFYFVTAATITFAGMATDRFGGRKVGSIGMIGFGATLLAITAVPASIKAFYALTMVLALFGTATTAVVFARIVVSFFRRSRGLALGILVGSTGMVSMPLAPVLAAVIATHGWRAGYLLLATAALLLGLSAVLFLVARDATTSLGKENSAPHEGLSFRAAVRTSDFWKIWLCVFAAALPLGGLINHLPAMLSDRGLSSGLAASMISLFLATTMIARIGVGFLFDRLYPPAVAAAVPAIAAGGTLLLLVLPYPSLPPIALGVIFTASAMGTEADIQNFFTGRQFGLRAYSTIVGVLAASVSVGLGMGATMFGFIFDETSSYEVALGIATGLFLFSAVTISLIGKPLIIRRLVPDR